MTAFWLIEIMNSGKIKLKIDKLTKSLGFLFIILTLSFIFSYHRVQSFWGSLEAEADTFFNFILFGLLFFFTANIFQKEEVNRILVFILAGGGILAFLYLINFPFKIFPWEFAQIPGFNPIGSSRALSIYLGGIFLIFLAKISCVSIKEITIFKKSISKRIIQGLILLFGILLFSPLFLIDDGMVWVGIIFGSLIIILGKLYLLPSFKNLIRELAFPLLVLLFSLILIPVKLPFVSNLHLPPEINLSPKFTLEIVADTLKESPKNFILGSGPATFLYSYLLHKPSFINLGIFWQTRFHQGATAFLTFLANFGILGTLALLLVMGIFVWQGLCSLIRLSSNNRDTNISTFAAGFYFVFFWFFSPFNLSLMFATFLMLGLWVVTTVSSYKEFSFYTKVQTAFLVMMLGIFLLAGVIIGIYKITQKYLAVVNYTQGINLFNYEKKTEEAITRIKKALSLDERDVFSRTLSQLFLVKVNELLEKEDISLDDKRRILQENILLAEDFALRATEINPKDSENWMQLGKVYERSIGFGTEADRLAVQSYQKAFLLDPYNPEIPLRLGRIYFSIAERTHQNIILLKLRGEEKREEEVKKLQEEFISNLNSALQKFQEAKNLKSNYAPAYYWLGRAYELRGEKNLAKDHYQIFLGFDPKNEEVKARIENLENLSKESN